MEQTLKQVQEQLQDLGSAQTRKVYARHGADVIRSYIKLYE